jgi:hypothetical protein
MKEVAEKEGRIWEETEQEELWVDVVERLDYHMTHLKWKHLRRKRKRKPI